ncbi:hypothetical protein MG293_013475, partial [Ovis ammon polii]
FHLNTCATMHVTELTAPPPPRHSDRTNRVGKTLNSEGQVYLPCFQSQFQENDGAGGSFISMLPIKIFSVFPYAQAEDLFSRLIDELTDISLIGAHSVGLMWWLLAREILRMRGTISREHPWEVMPDLYFYRDPEEIEKEEQAAAEKAVTKEEFQGD